MMYQHPSNSCENRDIDVHIYIFYFGELHVQEIQARKPDNLNRAIHWEIAQALVCFSGLKGQTQRSSPLISASSVLSMYVHVAHGRLNSSFKWCPGWWQPGVSSRRQHDLDLESLRALCPEGEQ